jgi:hypothetical protein
MRFLFQDPTIPLPLQAMLDHTAERANTPDQNHTARATRPPRSKPVLVWVNPRPPRAQPR